MSNIEYENETETETKTENEYNTADVACSIDQQTSRLHLLLLKRLEQPQPQTQQIGLSTATNTMVQTIQSSSTFHGNHRTLVAIFKCSNILVGIKLKHNFPSRQHQIHHNQNRLKMDQKLKSLIINDKSTSSNSSPASLINEQTTKLAQSIKSLFINMMATQTNDTKPNYDNAIISLKNNAESPGCSTPHDDDAPQHPEISKSTTTDGDKSSMNSTNLDQRQSPQLNELDNNNYGFDWPNSFLQLLNSLSPLKQPKQLTNNLQSNNSPTTTNETPSNDVRSPTMSPVSSLAIDDRDFELIALQITTNDDFLNNNNLLYCDTESDKNSVWLMNFATNNNIISLPASPYKPSIEYGRFLPSIDHNNNDIETSNTCDGSDQRKCAPNKKSNSSELLDRNMSPPTKLRRRKSLPICFNRITVVDFNQFNSESVSDKLPNAEIKSIHSSSIERESMLHVQDFDEDDDVATNNGASDCASPGSVSGNNRLTGLNQVNRDAERQDLERNTIKQKSSIDKVGDKDEQSLNSSVNETRQKKSSLSGNSTNDLDQQTSKPSEADGRYSLLQFALYNFREAIDKYSLESRANKAAQTGGSSGDTSTLRGSLKLIETLRSSRGSSSNAPGGGGGGGGGGGSSNQHERGSGKERKGLRLLQQPADGQRLQPGNGDWTWRELAEMVKFTQIPIKQSLLKLPSEDLNKRAVDCFLAIMQYMGDYVQSANNNNNNNSKQQPPQYQANEVECVYLILMNCHNFPILKDEIYCQLMKQTTNNRSAQPDSCLRGWRLFSIVAAYFNCSESFKPYLLKYLETAAYDKRRAYCSVAALCLQNLRKTFKFNGRKNVPSIEEIAATSAGRNSKRQIYRLPGGTERVINTKSTTVVDDIIHEICSNMLNVTDQDEMLEFSLYCIADGDLYTMPLNRDEYILDITTELIKNHQQYFLIFCRSIWHYPLRLDSKLYIEVIFNQIAPDYLEGLLLVLPSLRNGRKGVIDYKQPLRLKTKLVKEIARIAALLHRASGTDYMPHKDEVKYLLPKPIISAMKQHQRALIATEHLSAGSSAGSASSSTTSSSTTARNFAANDDGPSGQVNLSSGPAALADATAASTTVASPQTPTSYPLDTVITTPQKWIELVQNNWREMSAFDTLDAKAQFLDIVRHWPLFGSSFFAIKFIQRDLIQPMDFILALNKLGIQMLDMATHETIHKYPFNEVISTRKVRSEDGALFLDLKCGNLMKRSIIRIQTDQAHEISRLIRQYIDIELLQQKQRQQQQQFSNQQVEITGNDYISNCEQESG